MWFYLYFIVFAAIAAFVTINYSDLDFNDNPVINRFGANSICVMFDLPPFSLFGSTLWFPAVVLLLSFEVFDFIRFQDHYLCDDRHADDHDDKDHYFITNCFYVYYTASTLVESSAVILFAQIFATAPTEHLYMHTWPYLMFTFGFYLLILKRFLYLWKVGIVHKWYSVLWMALLSVSTVYKFVYMLLTLYGIELYSMYPWMAVVEEVNSHLWHFMTLIAPPIIYGFIGRRCRCVTMVLIRSD